MFVEDGTGQWRGIMKGELRRQATQSQEGATLRSLLPPETLPHLHPDHALEEALLRLSDLPLLPVVNRADFRKLERVVTLAGILETYREVGQRRSKGKHPRHA